MQTNESDWDLEAAEYVLGTQSEENTRVYDKLYMVDTDWQRRVHLWQTRFNCLHASTVPVQAPRRVLTKVLDRVDEIEQQQLEAPSATGSSVNDPQLPLVTQDSAATGESAGPAIVRAASSDVESESRFTQTLEQWRERARYWQLTSLVVLVAIAALVLIGPDYLNRQLQAPGEFRTVAVLQDEADAPLWVITHLQDSATEEATGGSVQVSMLGETESGDEQSYQLWMVPNDGAALESVGLVPAASGQSATLELPLALDQAEEFAVSLEPTGGAAGKQSGPLVSRTSIIQDTAD